MTKTELYYKLTGTENPKFITEREECIIVKCLDIINSEHQFEIPIVIENKGKNNICPCCDGYGELSKPPYDDSDICPECDGRGVI